MPFRHLTDALRWKTLYTAEGANAPTDGVNVMTAASMSRMVGAIMAFSIALVFAIQHVRREPPVDTKATTAAPAASKPASAREIGVRPRWQRRKRKQAHW